MSAVCRVMRNLMGFVSADPLRCRWTLRQALPVLALTGDGSWLRSGAGGLSGRRSWPLAGDDGDHDHRAGQPDPVHAPLAPRAKAPPETPENIPSYPYYMQ